MKETTFISAAAIGQGVDSQIFAAPLGGGGTDDPIRAVARRPGPLPAPVLPGHREPCSNTSRNSVPLENHSEGL
jgi:hypothetical protein